MLPGYLKNHKYAERQKMVASYGKEPETLDELAECVIKQISSKNPVAGFAWHVAHYYVSNNHNAPIEGETNWGNRKQGVPSGYLGWEGRVWIRYVDRVDGYGSDKFNTTLTYTGTGGWGGYDGPFQAISTARFKRYGNMYKGKDAYPEPQVYSWDYRFFDLDWPLINQQFEAEDIIKKLSGKDTQKWVHKFEWQDPTVVEADKKFIEECRALSLV
jgi:hypothetical protein